MNFATGEIGHLKSAMVALSMEEAFLPPSGGRFGSEQCPNFNS
jgi:hypothetical protein